MNLPHKSGARRLFPCLKPGCYLLSFKPAPGFRPVAAETYVGTLRVTGPAGQTRADDSFDRVRVSGDLYRLSNESQRELRAIGATAAEGWKAVVTSGQAVLPAFPIEDSRYYLEGIKVSGSPSQVQLTLQVHQYNQVNHELISGGTFQIELKPGATPPSAATRRAGQPQPVYPPNLVGTLTVEDKERGEFHLQWISPNLRRAAVRLFPVQPSGGTRIRIPGDSLPRGVPGFRKLFATIGWELQDFPHEVRASKVSGARIQEWSPFDLALAAKKLRQIPFPAGYSQHHWVYDLLCVSRFDQHQFLGIMFDAEATDLNRRARETAAVAALETVSVGESEGQAQDLFDGRLYYRTAVHELGHAMNLTHTLLDDGIMNTTNFLLPDQKKQGRMRSGDAFRARFAFNPKDRDWLQHAPDIAVRPGGISRYEVGWLCQCKKDVNVVSLRNEPDVELVVEPVRNEFPYGAPVRMNYQLVGHGTDIQVPSDISLRPGFVSGRVSGPDKVTRYFRSLFRCCDSSCRGGHLVSLARKSPMQSGMTLLRGIDGPLFPAPGRYEITLELRWDENGRSNRVVGQTTINILPPNASDPQQKAVAGLALDQPALMPALVEGLLDADGLCALSLALNTRTLAPHYLATALLCYRRGQTAKLDWDALLREAATIARSAARPSKSDAANRDRSADATEAKHRAGGDSAALCTIREQEYLKTLLNPPARPGKQPMVTADPAAAWLHKVMNATQPVRASAKAEMEDMLDDLRQSVAAQAVARPRAAAPTTIHEKRPLQSFNSANNKK